ncbi:class I SAM-dependent methyltransferase [Curtobacterium oceanosedimentum]|uniref:class I SAM-dependent methyltransferase n=1 Tax=Curtobacterium oceanosedimentum TaxID=465820 RepID=UPI0009EA7917|nr:class I SAM-dependent methyltransferase [Curtobacterium oceanosedimentum]
MTHLDDASKFCDGPLLPYRERGIKITEQYGAHCATLLHDGTDFFTYDVQPSEAEIEHFYDVEYPSSRRTGWYQAAPQYDIDRWTSAITRIEGLARRLRTNAKDLRVHDVGCGFGGLVHHLRERGYDATGTDLSAEAISGGRAERNNQWIHHERAEHFLAGQPKQHIVILNHMIEHSTDPLGQLRALRGTLAPGGYIIIRCPNSRFIRSVDVGIRDNWYGYPKHLQIFGPNSLRRLLEVVGFDDVEIGGTDTDMRIEGELELLKPLVEARGGASEDESRIVADLVASIQSKELEGVGRVSPLGTGR